jgi:hypothetical protein
LGQPVWYNSVAVKFGYIVILAVSLPVINIDIDVFFWAGGNEVLSDLELRKKLVKCYIRSIALYGAETWTLRTVDQKHVKVLKCCAGVGWRRSVGLIM